MNSDFSKINIVLDFDSTFVKVEGLEELARIILRENPAKDDILRNISEITKSGMGGDISFEESLSRRIKLFQPKYQHLEELVELLKCNVTNSIERNIDFFRLNCSHIYVISGGFMEWILPVLLPYKIPKENIFANEFLYSKAREIVGIDLNNPLSRSGGKVITVESLNLPHTTIVVGDGYTDYEIKKTGVCDRFVMFAENVRRPSVEKVADLVVEDWDEFLFKVGSLM